MVLSSARTPFFFFLSCLLFINISGLIQMWMVPLLTTEVIPSSRRVNFVQSVFSNITMIYEVNSKLLSALQRRQSEHPVVSQIGDVMLDHVVNFEPFVEYGARQYGGKMAFERERATNHEFDAFVKVSLSVCPPGYFI